MLTLKQLKDMKSGLVFRTGEDWDREDRRIRWVAKRGEGYHDWCIYYGSIWKTWEEVERVGDKICTESTIKDLVPCDDEAFEMYRY